jgi:hypothetical protein
MDPATMISVVRPGPQNRTLFSGPRANVIQQPKTTNRSTSTQITDRHPSLLAVAHGGRRSAHGSVGGCEPMVAGSETRTETCPCAGRTASAAAAAARTSVATCDGDCPAGSGGRRARREPRQSWLAGWQHARMCGASQDEAHSLDQPLDGIGIGIVKRSPPLVVAVASSICQPRPASASRSRTTRLIDFFLLFLDLE